MWSLNVKLECEAGVCELHVKFTCRTWMCRFPQTSFGRQSGSFSDAPAIPKTTRSVEMLNNGTKRKSVETEQDLVTRPSHKVEYRITEITEIASNGG